MVLNPLTFAKLPYKTLADFTGITAVASGPVVIAVHPGVQANTVQELIALARAAPGKINFATVGTGGFTRVNFELLKSTAKVDIRYVPYKGGAQAITEVLGGHVEAIALDLAPLMSFVKSGKLRGLGITSEKRNPELPSSAHDDRAGHARNDRRQLVRGAWSQEFTRACRGDALLRTDKGDERT